MISIMIRMIIMIERATNNDHFYTSDKNNGHGGANYEDDFDDNDGGDSPGESLDDFSGFKC